MTPHEDTNLPRLSDAYADRYQEQGYWDDETMIDSFTDTVDKYPDATVVGPNRRVTFRDFDHEVRRVSARLQRIGIEPGDVVSYQLPNWVTTVVLHHAITHVGAIANPIVPIYRESEVAYILQNSSSKCVVVPNMFRDFDYASMIDGIAEDLPALEHVIVVGTEPTLDASVETISYDRVAETDQGIYTRPEIGADDLHALLYTSGTTGDPKGVFHSHNTDGFEQQQTIDTFGLSWETTVFMPSPVTHVTGMLYGLEMPFLRGMDVVLMTEWDPVEAIDLIEQHGCNFTIGSTPFLQGLADEAPENWDCPLRVFCCGGADVPPELVRRATETLGCTVMRVYGSTEFPTVTWPPLDAPLEKFMETDGPAARGVDIKIVDLETGEVLPPDENGELLARGPDLMVGYLGEELNAEAFEGGWFKTGDLAVMDEDGYIEITGRLKDIIIRGGENIPVKDVEDRLFEHPAIEDVAVVAMPDPEMQEKGCAYVTVQEGHEFTFNEMVSYLDDQRIAKQKFPERLEVIDSFPMTASGKIQKNLLRQRIADKLGMDPITR